MTWHPLSTEHTLLHQHFIGGDFIQSFVGVKHGDPLVLPHPPLPLCTAMFSFHCDVLG